MSANKDDSLRFYNYLCYKIGTAKMVRARRLAFTVSDIENISDEYDLRISSGSAAEGLDMAGSDIDLMFLRTTVSVYETEHDAIKNADMDKKFTFIMDTKDTKPCFTRLYLFKSEDAIVYSAPTFEIIGNDYVLSSELFKSFLLPKMQRFKIHGPCLTTPDDIFDFAQCIKCDKWISAAQEWIIRPRSSWPSSNLLFKIISFGVLFVPIGSKGSPNERLEWRISFSVAEKLLIYSFNQTQLLCYALMKTLLKEIINKNEKLNGLLCSYFIKTLIFWILEESNPSMWRPDNIIPCAMYCLKRLLYCVKHSTLLHYFIIQNNLFEDRFDANNKPEMMSTLTDLLKRGWRCFLLSKTFGDYSRTLQVHVSEMPFGHIDLIRGFMLKVAVLNSFQFRTHKCYDTPLYILKHKSRNTAEKELMLYFLSTRHQRFAHTCTKHQIINNKQYYGEYKQLRYHLLLGLRTDAVSGWMLFASFLYVNKLYTTSLSVTRYALSKCSPDKLYSFFEFKPYHMQTKDMLTMTKCIGLPTLITASTIDDVFFEPNSSLIPNELLPEMVDKRLVIAPVVFGHFLSFLCCYHLGDIRSAMDALQKIVLTMQEKFFIGQRLPLSNALFCLGIAFQMIGDKNQARQCFDSRVSVTLDEVKHIHLALRLPKNY